MTPGSSPLRCTFSAEETKAAVDEAHRLGLPVAAHCQNVHAIRNCVAAGADTIEHCRWQDHEGRPAFDAVLGRDLARKGLAVMATMPHRDRVMLRSADEQETLEHDCQLKARHAGLPAVLELGVPVAVASDAGVRDTRFEELSLSIECAAAALGLHGVELVCAATAVAAAVCGIGDEVGTIAVGRVADLVSVKGDPASDVESLRYVRRVWFGGALVHDADEAHGPKLVSRA